MTPFEDNMPGSSDVPNPDVTQPSRTAKDWERYKTVEVTPQDIEAQRRAQWKGAVEQELQVLVREAADIRGKITSAKTNTKKVYYNKKFKAVQQKVMQMVAALQRLEAQEAQRRGVEEHVHDENCNHDHEEATDGNPSTDSQPE